MEIGFISWFFFFFFTCYWIGAFSILFILIKSQHCSWKADASCRTHCQVHIAGFHQVILVDVLKPSHRWVLCPRLILPPISIPKVRGEWDGMPFRTFTGCLECWCGEKSQGLWLSCSFVIYLILFEFPGVSLAIYSFIYLLVLQRCREPGLAVLRG